MGFIHLPSVATTTFLILEEYPLNNNWCQNDLKRRPLDLSDWLSHCKKYPKNDKRKNRFSHLNEREKSLRICNVWKTFLTVFDESINRFVVYGALQKRKKGLVYVANS